jgi:hypothetical protein
LRDHRRRHRRERPQQLPDPSVRTDPPRTRQVSARTSLSNTARDGCALNGFMTSYNATCKPGGRQRASTRELTCPTFLARSALVGFKPHRAAEPMKESR